MSDNSAKRSGGIGFFGMLAILFIGLKLGGIIAWSWWWVLAPLWGPLAFALLLIVFGVLIALALGASGKNIVDSLSEGAHKYTLK